MIFKTFPDVAKRRKMQTLERRIHRRFDRCCHFRKPMTRADDIQLMAYKIAMNSSYGKLGVLP